MRFTIVPFLAAGAVLVAGCAATVSGTASPAEGPVPIALLDPCALLVKSDLASYGEHKDPERESLGGARICRYSQTGGYASDRRVSVSVGIRDSQSADSVKEQGHGKITGKVNGRKAIKVPIFPPDDCLLTLAVGETARVDIVVVANRMESCDVAAKFADVIEPRLPKP